MKAQIGQQDRPCLPAGAATQEQRHQCQRDQQYHVDGSGITVNTTELAR